MIELFLKHISINDGILRNLFTHDYPLKKSPEELNVMIKKFSGKA